MGWFKNALKGWSPTNFFSGKNADFENMVGNSLNNLTGASDAAAQEYQYNLNLWNMQNAYNTPAAQIARMKDAGIDVNPMTYAVGNGNMSTTASSPSSTNVSASGINPLSSLMSVISGLAGIKTQAAQKDNLEALARQTDALTPQRIRQAKLENDISAYNLHYARDHGLPYESSPSWDKFVMEKVSSAQKRGDFFDRWADATEKARKRRIQGNRR